MADATTGTDFSTYLDTTFSGFGSGTSDPSLTYTGTGIDTTTYPNQSYTYGAGGDGTGGGMSQSTAPSYAAILADLMKAGGAGAQWGISGQQAQAAASAADPFAPQRGQYAQMLNDLITGKMDPSKMPGYEFGMQAVERSQLAQGYQGSGKMATALQDYAGAEFTDMAKLLGHLAGADIGSPAAAGQALTSGSKSQSSDFGTMLSQVGQIAGIAASIYAMS